VRLLSATGNVVDPVESPAARTLRNGKPPTGRPQSVVQYDVEQR